MKKLLFVGLAILLLMPVVASAQNAFDGTWKIDLKKAEFPKKPDVYLLQNGMYQCKTCVPPIDVKADGQDQKVTGHPYYDSVAIKVVNDHEIEETDKKNGKTVATSKMTVSSDGNTLMFSFTDSSNTNADPVTGKGEETRVAKGPAGSNAISGSWRTTKMETMSDNGLMWTYKVSGDELTMTTPTGQSYTAKLNGGQAPIQRRSGHHQRLGKDDGQEHAGGDRLSRRQGHQCCKNSGRSRWQDDEAYGGRQTARHQERIYGDETVMHFVGNPPSAQWRVGAAGPSDFRAFCNSLVSCGLQQCQLPRACACTNASLV